MTLYWLSGPYLPLKEWTKVYASKYLSQNTQKIKLNIGQTSYQLSLENSFTEILSENLPIKFVPDAFEFELSDHLQIICPSWSIFSRKYNIETIDNFLKTPDCLFYNFTEEPDNWIIIKWSQTAEESIVFQTLRSFQDKGIILLTKSSYNLN